MTSEKWLQRIYGMREAHEFIYEMNEMQYPELKSLMEFKLCYNTWNPALGAKGRVSSGYQFNMPRWVSDWREFSLYNKMFTILSVRYEGREVWVHVADIDDGDNRYIRNFVLNDKAESAANKFYDTFKDEEVVDCRRLKGMLNEFEFKRA